MNKTNCNTSEATAAFPLAKGYIIFCCILRTLAVSIQHTEVKSFGVITFYQVANMSLKNTLNVFTG